MAMTVLNNTAAQMTLGELNKNITRVGKDLAKISKGERVYNAAADTSAYAISEKMRTRIRALEQDERNVQNGVCMLKVAEGGVKEQIELMKLVKERVINAANDSNTDDDRRIIQKEIDQFYKEIDDIAEKTIYNGRQVLKDGSSVTYTPIKVWKARNNPPLVSRSDQMHVIYQQALRHYVPKYPNNQPPYAELDGWTGPFDIFDDYKEETLSKNNLAGGQDGEACKLNMDFSYLLTRTGTNDFELDDFKDIGFAIKGVSETGAEDMYQFVLTDDLSKHYINTQPNYYFYGVDISNCASTDDVLDNIVSTLQTVRSGQFAHFFDIEKNDDSTGIVLTSKNYSTASNKSYVEGISDEGMTDDDRSATMAMSARDGATATHVFFNGEHFTGGQNQKGDSSYDPVSNPDVPPFSPATFASITKNINSAPVGSGFAVSGYLGDQQYIKLVGGTEVNQVKGGVWEIGKDANVNYFSIGAGINFSLNNGEMTLRSNHSGNIGNDFHIVSDGFPPYEVNAADWKRYYKYTGDVVKQESTRDSSTAVYNLDVSSWRGMDTEELISELRGTALKVEFNRADRYSNVWHMSGQIFEFLDKDNLELLGARSAVSYSVPIDLAALRSDEYADKNPADALMDILKSYIPMEPEEEDKEWNPPHIKFLDSGGNDVTSNPENVAAIRFFSNAPGERGNSENVKFIKGNLRTYEIDYGTWFNSEEGQNYKIPEDLNGKGFRVYCATCPDQWFNIVFETSEGVDVIDKQPAFIEKDSRLANIVVDVNNVTDAASLSKAIYEQGEAAMKVINHYLHFALDEENPDKLIIYDARNFDFSSGTYPNLQEKGVKIADGFTDNYELTIEYERSREKGDKKLYIHDTDKANMNICIKLPGTTLANIFDYDPMEEDASAFHVMTKESRDAMLGTKEKPGHIDNAIEYLTDSNTLIGSQIMRLQQSERNIVTQQEATTNSESVIRDLDMAKAMTDYTKHNVLMQSAQSMLSQANQNASGVLGLLG